MKRIIKVTSSLLLLVFTLMLLSCGKKEDSKLKIVATIYPEYDFVREITKDIDNISIDLIIESSVDFHSFSPSVDDIISIKNADLLLYIGGESDEWVKDALKDTKNKNMSVLCFLDLLGEKALEEETKEGMDSDEDETELDEHIWLSIKNAIFMCEKIKEALINIDSNNSELYENNASLYINKLNELDNKFEDATTNINNRVLLFGDRFPFLYLFKDYNLDYYAAFKGCQAQSEASFETIAFLINKVDELDLKVIYTIEGGNNKIANAIKNGTKKKNQTILTLNSLQSIPTKNGKLDKSITYLEVMDSNLESLKLGVA